MKRYCLSYKNDEKFLGMEITEAINDSAFCERDTVVVCKKCNAIMHESSWSDNGNLCGVCKAKPNRHDALYTLISSMTTYVAEHKDVISVNELDNAFAYSESFPSDYVMMFYDNLTYIDGINLKMMKCPSVKAWINRRK